MALAMNVKQAIATEGAASYQKATKKNKEKHVLLNERIKMIGYDRCYLARLLRSRAKKLRFGGKIVIVGDLKERGPPLPSSRFASGSDSSGGRPSHPLLKF